MTTTTSQRGIGARIAHRLAKAVGPRRYTMWFDRSARLDYDDQGHTLRVAVPNRFVAERIERHFGQDLRHAAAAELGADVALNLQVDPQGFTAPSRHPATAAIGDQARGPAQMGQTDRVVPVPGLRHRLEQFVVGPCNELAFAAASRLAEDDPHAGHPLFLHGGCGLGKTHLLQGICHRLQVDHPDRRVLYTTGEQFTNAYITAVRTNRLDAFRRKIRALELLALDDVHFMASKEKTQQEFLHTFDQIDRSGARVVLASDCPPKLIKQFSAALASRCAAGLVVRINPPNPETRVRLLEALAGRRQLCLLQGVAEALAGRCGASIREIEGMLSTLHAMASLAQPGANGRHGPATVNHALAQRLFETETTALQLRRPVRFQSIMNAVTRLHGLTAQQVLGRSRHRAVVVARSLLIHLARRLTSMSYPEIAAAMGRRNHSTIITAAKRVDRQLAANEPIWLPGEPGPLTPAELVERLKRELARS